MDTVTALRQFVKSQHDWLEATLDEVNAAQANWTPAGNANSIAAKYAHLVVSEDLLVNTIANRKPPEMGDWSALARRVRVDFPAARAYAHAVYANTDAFLSGLSGAALDRPVDLLMFNDREMPLSLFIAGFGGGHAGMPAGEISCLKGLHGLRDYPV